MEFSLKIYGSSFCSVTIDVTHLYRKNKSNRLLRIYLLKNTNERYLNISNNIPMQVLGWLSSIQKRNKINEAKEKL